ncbi:nuclear mRNA export, poly(A)+RNA binding protein [Coemansia sp. RSA 1933]|nr:nuclear mRNA export, poly(A)+RNA binding protein [Coemansia sp. RSA 1933]
MVDVEVMRAMRIRLTRRRFRITLALQAIISLLTLLWVAFIVATYIMSGNTRTRLTSDWVILITLLLVVSIISAIVVTIRKYKAALRFLEDPATHPDLIINGELVHCGTLRSTVPFPGSPAFAAADGPVQVSIKGWRGDTEDALVRFLNNKAGRPVNIENINYIGDIMYISVSNRDIAQDLLKLNGIWFSGTKLSLQLRTHPVKFRSGSNTRNSFGSHSGGAINANNTSSSNDSATIKDRLMTLIQVRADTQSKSLDLSSLSQDSVIATLGADPSRDGKIFKAILVIASQMYPNLETINLADNAFHSLKPIADIGAHYPDLKNLSLMNNRIADMRELDCLSSIGSTVPLSRLSEIILIGNPVCDTELSQPNGAAAYLEKVQARFPTITMLDTSPVAPVSQPGRLGTDPNSTVAPKQMPFPSEHVFSENQSISDLVNAFVPGFFGLYDGNRAGLADIYAPTAQFSLMVDSTQPTNSFVRSSSDSHKHIDLTTYIHTSRNMARIKSHQKKVSSLASGHAAVMQTILQLPATHHPVKDAQKFCFDAWETHVPSAASPPQVLAMVVVHGEFTDVPTQNVLSFDRTFVLAPAPPGSTAATAGSPCIIVNDMLTIRRYNGFHSWTSTQEDATASAGVSSNLAPEQQEMARALQEQTGLTAEWTLKYLENYGWNFQLAISEFPQVRGSLPPDAFQ